MFVMHNVRSDNKVNEDVRGGAGNKPQWKTTFPPTTPPRTELAVHANG